MNRTPFIKPFAAILLVLSFIVPFSFSNVYAAKTEPVQIEIYAKGSLLSFPLPPFLLNHTTMAPIRPIAEAIEANITWNKKTKTVTVIKSNRQLSFQVGSKLAYLNGKAVKLDSKIELVDGMAIVPVRLTAEALQQKVEWIPTIHTVQILEQNQLSISKAEKLVRQELKLSSSSSAKVEFDHSEENGELYIIHVYKEIQTKEQAHTATIGWYYVHSYTGKVESMF